jgi:GT2 family glycosyltransferase
VFQLSVVIPFHRNVAVLRRVLAPFADRPDSVELILAVDGSADDWKAAADAVSARAVVLPVTSGPAAARNRGAGIARGSVLVFVDGDVVAAPDALTRISEFFATFPHAAAVFGAYDESPDAPSFVSQYRNLSHRYVHCTTHREARTFWAGLGAVRADAFHAVGGFDESFTRPCVEDIDLGYRLTAAGFQILVEPSIEGKHLKRWTLLSSISSDVRDRGIPWTQLLLGARSDQVDLNLTGRLRWSVVTAYVLVLLLVAAPFWPLALSLATIALGTLILLNLDYYRYFRRVRGPVFAVGVIPLHLVHHLCNGLSFGTGALLFHLQRMFGLELPGSLPAGRATTHNRVKPPVEGEDRLGA